MTEGPETDASRKIDKFEMRPADNGFERRGGQLPDCCDFIMTYINRNLSLTWIYSRHPRAHRLKLPFGCQPSRPLEAPKRF
jgi:hypothetical protein